MSDHPLFPALLISVIAAACAGRPAAEAASPGTPAPAPERVTLSRTVVTPIDAATIPELYERAKARLAAGDAAGAARELDRVYTLDPQGPLAPDALYEAALAHEQAGDRQTALARFEELARRFPDHTLGREALVRSIRLLAYMEKWRRAGEVAERLLTRYDNLTPFESIVGLGAKALWLVSQGDAENATFHVEKARSIVEAHRLDAAGKIPRDLAQLYFALGEARRIRAERIKFDPLPKNFAVTLEERCQLLLDAQSAYSDSMRAYDAHWSAMAGYRVGELYQKLHEDLMGVPLPKAADSEARKQLFEGAMRLRYSVLLDKALAMMEHTLGMAQRTGERSDWVRRAEEAKRQLELARTAENAAIDRLPYTRDQLRAALDDLAKKKSAPR